MIVGLSSNQVTSSDDVINRSQGLWKDEDMEITKPASADEAIRCQQPQQRQQGPPLRCPRCDSANTKFCYYNNYSRSQPRHFCKGCRRHWTNGGTLRNVPVGGRRKAKRPKSTSSHHPQTSAPNSTADIDASSTINDGNGNGDDVPTTAQPSQQVLPPPSFGQLLQLPLTPTEYGNNGDMNTSFLGALLPLPPLHEFDGSGMISSHDVDGGGGGYAPATSTPFPSLLSYTGQEDLGGIDPILAVAMATPWVSLPPSSCSSGPGTGGGSTITTSGGPAVLEPSSPSSCYWGSCWDDLTGFLSPDHRHPTPPPLPPPPQDLQLS